MMNAKKISIFLASSLILLILLNIAITCIYKNYIILVVGDVVDSLVEKYPEEEINIIKKITEKKSHKKDIIKKYGIQSKELESIASFKKVKNNTIIITTLIYVAILSILFLLYLIYSLKVKKEINVINKYLQEILKGTYDLNIADYNEDELSLLKNDIYKVTMKLKELSEYEKKEQIYLMNTLEDISHQLKTPLTALMVTNDILKDNKLTKKEQNLFIKKQEKELEKINWLITTLLKYSKLDSGSVKLKKEKVHADTMMKDIMGTLSIALELKNISIETKNLDFTLTCDKNWTKEAFTNILKNAYEHIENKGKIRIEGEDNPLYQKITITDNGSGIKKEDIKNIFKRFYTTNTSKNSIGIGLNMAKLIIEKQNGKIEVESEVGCYTTFKVYFMKKKNY